MKEPNAPKVRKPKADTPKKNAVISILALMEVKKDQLSRSEKHIYDLVIANGDQIQWMTLSDFAAFAGVSEPTVIRFCRAIGLDGFSDFKIRLAQSLASGVGDFHRNIHTQLPLRDISEKIFEAAQEELIQAEKAIDISGIEAATRLLVSARRIDIYATGSGNIVAATTYQNLMRLGLPVSHNPDAHVQTHSAATLGVGDVVLVFSFTGEVRDNLRCMRIAKESGATAIAFTRAGSHLAEEADLVVNIDPDEDTFRYSPMSARIVHMVISDILCTSVGLALGDEAAVLVKRVKYSLKDQWLKTNG
ncbi:HTH-type transcriptional regulator HexR [Thalassocella blandensis]|nr:HTH-type transcriptional regulator HexR [Thalassocella blandensis]